MSQRRFDDGPDRAVAVSFASSRFRARVWVPSFQSRPQECGQPPVESGVCAGASAHTRSSSLSRSRQLAALAACEHVEIAAVVVIVIVEEQTYAAALGVGSACVHDV